MPCCGQVGASTTRRQQMALPLSKSEIEMSTFTNTSFTGMMETDIEMENKEEIYIVMEKLKLDGLKTAHAIPSASSESKFPNSDNGSEFPWVTTQSTKKNIHLSLLCRLCANPNSRMTDIFYSDAVGKDIPSMIHLCLPIMVRKTDTLPIQVCQSCLEELERCYRFHQTVAEAEEKLLALARVRSDNPEEAERNWEPFPSYDRQHCPKGGTSDVEMSNTKSTSSLGEGQAADTTATKNVLLSRSRPYLVVLPVTETLHEDKFHTKKYEKSLSDPEHPNLDSTTEAFENGTTTACETIQQGCDSEVIGATYSKSVAAASQDKEAEHIVDPTVRERRYRCTTCAKMFKTESHLDNHNQIHVVHRELYKCNLCSKLFKSQCGLSGHQKLHIGVTELHRCNSCSRTYKSKASLSVHQKFHTGDGLHSCRYCAKLFPNKNNRDRHHLVHTGERPFKCSMCEKRFAHSSTLKRHVAAIHSSKRDFPCSMCDKSFKTLQDSKRHLLVHIDKNEAIDSGNVIIV